MSIKSLKRKLNHISRTLLLDGSPANRTIQWALTIFITGVWIYRSEKKKPQRKGIFFRTNKADMFDPHEIQHWNSQFKAREYK